MIRSPQALLAQLADPQVRVLDIRGTVTHQDLGAGFEQGIYQGSQAAYAAGHIPGAVFIDWTTDIVDPLQTIKAQIATPAAFAQVMGRLGIGPSTKVVIYDQGPMQFATRLWWALKYYGHDAVAVLDGGFPAWQEAGYPVTTEVPNYPAQDFVPQIRPEWRIETAELVDLLGQVKIIDARPSAHYRGERSRSQRKGHIPTAINLPRPDLLIGTHFKTLEQWHDQFAQLGITPEDTVVAYCNGGVAASTVLFALDRLGYSKLRLYDGSWNEWGNRTDLPIGTA